MIEICLILRFFETGDKNNQCPAFRFETYTHEVIVRAKKVPMASRESTGTTD